MAEAIVRIIKYDAGSPTDKALVKMQGKLQASSAVEAMRRSVTIADTITDLAKQGSEVLVRAADGTVSKLVIS